MLGWGRSDPGRCQGDALQGSDSHFEMIAVNSAWLSEGDELLKSM